MGKGFVRVPFLILPPTPFLPRFQGRGLLYVRALLLLCGAVLYLTCYVPVRIFPDVRKNRVVFHNRLPVCRSSFPYIPLSERTFLAKFLHETLMFKFMPVLMLIFHP